MGHDQLFKEFLRAFFRDFLELFCPDIAARLDFGTVRFLEKELFTDFPEGSLREADVVAEVDTQDGIEGLVLVLPAAGQRDIGDASLRLDPDDERTVSSEFRLKLQHPDGLGAGHQHLVA